MTPRSILLRIKEFQKIKWCRENQNTHLMFNNFFPENRAVYEISWKNVVEPVWPHDNTNGAQKGYDLHAG